MGSWLASPRRMGIEIGVAGKTTQCRAIGANHIDLETIQEMRESQRIGEGRGVAVCSRTRPSGHRAGQRPSCSFRYLQATPHEAPVARSRDMQIHQDLVTGPQGRFSSPPCPTV